MMSAADNDTSTNKDQGGHYTSKDDHMYSGEKESTEETKEGEAAVAAEESLSGHTNKNEDEGEDEDEDEVEVDRFANEFQAQYGDIPDDGEDEDEDEDEDADDDEDEDEGEDEGEDEDDIVVIGVEEEYKGVSENADEGKRQDDKEGKGVVDSNPQTNEQILNSLLDDHKLSRVIVPRDGNCLYHSLADQLQVRMYI